MNVYFCKIARRVRSRRSVHELSLICRISRFFTIGLVFGIDTSNRRMDQVVRTTYPPTGTRWHIRLLMRGYGYGKETNTRAQRGTLPSGARHFNRELYPSVRSLFPFLREVHVRNLSGGILPSSPCAVDYPKGLYFFDIASLLMFHGFPMGEQRGKVRIVIRIGFRMIPPSPTPRPTTGRQSTTTPYPRRSR